MNGNSLLIDTNIVLYLLDGDETLVALLEEKQLFLSFISELELLTYGSLNDQEISTLKRFIKDCVVVDISLDIKELCIKQRKNHQLKLPDAIIVATAQFLNIPLVSADSDFKKVKDADIIFYEK